MKEIWVERRLGNAFPAAESGHCLHNHQVSNERRADDIFLKPAANSKISTFGDSKVLFNCLTCCCHLIEIPRHSAIAEEESIAPIMNQNFPSDLRHNSTVKSFNGCWTCRLRRKKCDERRPTCNTCASLLITCYYSHEKPEWMDGGEKQENMARKLKEDIKDRRRLGELPKKSPRDPIPSVHDLSNGRADVDNDGMRPRHEALPLRSERGTECALLRETAGEGLSFDFERSDTIHFVFYLEHLFPFLFPFYHPSLLGGGKAWILEMMLSSPVVRQALLCQSEYFFLLTLAQGPADRDLCWETMHSQTQSTFGMLRAALQVITSSNIKEHMHGAVRIMASILQIQRFEIAILSFNNCQLHLDGALAVFQQLLDNSGITEPACPSSRFRNVENLLGPSSQILPSGYPSVPSAEQAALRFSTSLLILDDIVASTMLQEIPRLYEYHYSLLLGSMDGEGPPVDLEAVIGCQNWVLFQIGEIAVLDAWRQRCKAAGNLSVMELVRRATVIKDALEAHLRAVETTPASADGNGSLLDLFTGDLSRKSTRGADQTFLVTRVWGHAALLYLSVVVSGWQPANVDVRYHVDRVVELLTHQISPSSLLRTMVWPFCVAGCLAEPMQETHFRSMVEALQPPRLFGTVRKALEIMENVWHSRHADDATHRDLATCFRSENGLVLLV